MHYVALKKVMNIQNEKKSNARALIYKKQHFYFRQFRWQIACKHFLSLLFRALFHESDKRKGSTTLMVADFNFHNECAQRRS